MLLSSRESINAVKWLRKLITSGASPKSVTNFSENEALQVFESGDAALMRNWPYAWAELQKENSAVKGKVSITTMVSKEGHNSVSTLGSWGFSILKSSLNKKESFKAIKYLTSIKSQRELFLSSGYTPTHTILFRDKNLIKVSPILPQLENALKKSKPRPQTPLYAQISDVLQSQLSAILTGKQTVEEAMQMAQDKTQKIITSAGDL